MSLRVAAILSVATLATSLASALPAQADYVRCATPWSCERVSDRQMHREMRALYAANTHWQPWYVDTYGARPYSRFDVEALRLMTRMP
ncbi:hypothetical protein VQ02_06980 [Methylobacterium variabile]|jgi:hypothetical protein|uniref:Lipoprotein n=1 Tax=Methylobacterium variabile TaxID=298794 RepID=A0A0J6T031_9HYPH|nr:hypothetical protein [Methylobacterium variabile]KMO40800.1 hypothetical protein VQ02_06980 [Methylobacterium variabile]